ncbi:thioesterase [Flaviaesturariibacter flavus]|uniref:Thioesterase n=1 Tax=Flaviaesturariibacter flavus TaxID=2502780 RepID=A0A4R1BJS0_9BACT|nr:thioesterase family protein [Flaviaesturariibacter flavus]TCJ17563.1 thioesterase [Flaviaesturariibacter flavus]
MPRIRIELPEKLPFSTTIPVRVTDLNYGNHLGNHALLGLMHEARMQYLASLGATELCFFGVALIMSDSAIEYKGEAFFGDQLQFEVGAAEISRVGFELYYRVTKDAGKTLIALAKTGMVCFNYDARKVVAVPEEAKTALVG